MWLRDSGENPSSAAWSGRYDQWLEWLDRAVIVAAASLDHKGRAVDPHAIGDSEEVRPLP